MSSEQFIEIKQNFEQYQQTNQEVLTIINNKLETKMNDSRTMIREQVKDILQAELKEIIPDIVSTILQQIKSSTDKLLHTVKDVPVQTKTTITDKVSVLTATTQGASTESWLESDEMLAYQSEDSDNILTQEEVETQKCKQPEVKSHNNKTTNFPRNPL
eukprot:7886910-Ditylum_brightwellii.AAC.1